MTFHSSIDGVVLASAMAIAASSAFADDISQRDDTAQTAPRWTGFYAGAGGGLGRSTDSSVGGSKDAGATSELPGGQQGYNLPREQFKIGLDDFDKAFTSGKQK